MKNRVEVNEARLTLPRATAQTPQGTLVRDRKTGTVGVVTLAAGGCSCNANVNNRPHGIVAYLDTGFWDKMCGEGSSRFSPIFEVLPAGTKVTVEQL